ncbi:hypothetical protein ACI78R_18195 [Geodermatophilus sp. SYSU D01106]
MTRLAGVQVGNLGFVASQCVGVAETPHLDGALQEVVAAGEGAHAAIVEGDLEPGPLRQALATAAEVCEDGGSDISWYMT